MNYYISSSGVILIFNEIDRWNEMLDIGSSNSEKLIIVHSYRLYL